MNEMSFDSNHIDILAALSDQPSDINELLYSELDKVQSTYFNGQLTTDVNTQHVNSQHINTHVHNGYGHTLNTSTNGENPTQTSPILYDITQPNLLPVPVDDNRKNRTISSSSYSSFSPESGISMSSSYGDGDNRSPPMAYHSSPEYNQHGTSTIVSADSMYIENPNVHNSPNREDLAGSFSTTYSLADSNNLEMKDTRSDSITPMNIDGELYDERLFPSYHGPSLLNVPSDKNQTQHQITLGGDPKEYLGTIDLNNLLQLAEESNQLLAQSTVSDINMPPRFQNTQHNVEANYHMASASEGSAPFDTAKENYNNFSSEMYIHKVAPVNYPTPSVIVNNTANTNIEPVMMSYFTGQQNGEQKKINEPKEVVNQTSRYSIPGIITFKSDRSNTGGEMTLANQNLPCSIVDMVAHKVVGDEDDEKNQNSLTPSNKSGEYFCYVCGEKAGKHSYYGGQVCASCRAFFRRSVQSKYFNVFKCKKDRSCTINILNRKNCQFCRFKKCIESGMKPSWVLSDEERNRRFNKLNKPNSKSSNFESTTDDDKKSLMLSELYVTFTQEEQNLLSDMQSKFQVDQELCFQNILLLDKKAGMDFLTSALSDSPIGYNTYKVFQKGYQLYFHNNIVPNFTSGTALSTKDISNLRHGDNAGVAHYFKSSQMVKISNARNVYPKSGCNTDKYFKDIAKNKDLVDRLNLSEIFSNMDLTKKSYPNFPSYSDLYPQEWVSSQNQEKRHWEILNKIQSWPRWKENEPLDCSLAVLMTVIILFHADFNPRVDNKAVETIQLKYCVLLQRYLRSKLSPEAANKKFLEAMLLLSLVKEIWEMDKF